MEVDEDEEDGENEEGEEDSDKPDIEDDGDGTWEDIYGRTRAKDGSIIKVGHFCALFSWLRLQGL